MTGITKSDIATVIEKKATKRAALSIKENRSGISIDTLNRKPKRMPANVVKTASFAQNCAVIFYKSVSRMLLIGSSRHCDLPRILGILYSLSFY